MVGLVVVSHSARAAAGIAEVAGEMGGDTRIEAVGGDGQGGLGTVPGSPRPTRATGSSCSSTWGVP